MRTLRSCGLVTLACLAVVSCDNGGNITPDDGTDDGVVDAGTADAGIPDAGTPDAGAPDAGTPDAGVPDAGTPDAGAPDAGTPDAGSADVTEIKAGDLVVAPGGKESAPGTLASPTTFTSAITKIAAGSTIHMRGGTYSFSSQITIQKTNSGSAGKPKSIRAYAGETPILDFSSQSSGRGFQINGSYWHVFGLIVQKSADCGIYVGGNNNVIERCITRYNGDTGLQISRAGSETSRSAWPSNNLILDCESHDNKDSSGENADGFAAKLTVGTGNVFRGCVAHHNIDDGWDLFSYSSYEAIGPVTIDRCISHHNGKLSDGTTNANGDRNGFKLGGQSVSVAHVVTRSVAYGNGAVGFTWNSNPGAIRLANNLSFDNAGGNYYFGSGSAAVFTNNVSFWTSTSSDKSDKINGTDASSTNCWWDTSKSQPSVNAKGLVVTAADFASSLSNPSIKRLADGSLDFSPFALASGSDLVNAGVVPSGTLPFEASYYQGKPDLGAVEQ